MDAALIEWTARNGLGLGTVACAVVGIVETAKRAGHAAGGDLDAPRWQAALRWWLPLMAGAVMGAVPGVWTPDVSVGLGVIAGTAAGGPLGRVVYMAVRKRVPGLLTSEARASGRGSDGTAG